MTRQEFVTFLSKNKGYLKKGSEWLSNNFNISIEDIKEAKRTFRGNVKINRVQEDVALTKSIDSISINNPGTYWITGCTHAPWHNKRMYDSTLNFLSKEVELNGLILAGDFIDANSISNHDIGNIPLPGVTLDWEYKESNKLLDQFDDLTKNYDNVNKIFLYGNHEDRFNRLIKKSDVNKYGKAFISPEKGLKLDKRDYTVLTDWRSSSVQIGRHLEVNHGEFCNVHTAKKTIDTFRKSILYFHTHRFQIYMEGQNGGFNMGFGGDINAPIFNYATRAMKSSWNNASALVTLDKEGFYHVQPLLYMGRKLIVNGKQY